jgi:hypothetical protein
MAEAFVRTIKRDYVRVSPCPDAKTACTSYQLGSITTTRFTRTRHSDIVHPVSSSQLTEARDRVRSFGGYNTKRPVHHGLSLRSDGSDSVFVKLESVSFRNRPRGSRASRPIQ